jgi:hypothetical protein
MIDVQASKQHCVPEKNNMRVQECVGMIWKAKFNL